ncbi:MAG: iron chelate uptake ABC transporter family permease subunit, partial [Pseudomonadota bacterium]
MTHRATLSRLMLILYACTALSLIAACGFGSISMGFSRITSGLLGYGSDGDVLIIWSIRLPRALAAYVVGVALGISGAALQGLLRNPLAEPGILGVSASASLAATFVI